jgi:arginine/lysine/ornithine decarboxylase
LASKYESDQQDIAQFGSVPAQHQQHPKRYRAPDQGARGYLPSIDSRRVGTDYAGRRSRRGCELIVDTPELPDFSHFHDVFRDDPTSASRHGHIREAFYLAYDADNCEHIQLYGEQIEDRLANGPELVGANFIIPYPPGFPVIVPGQVVTADIVTFLRALDVNEIHGYDPHRGLKLLRPQVLAAMAAD